MPSPSGEGGPEDRVRGYGGGDPADIVGSSGGGRENALGDGGEMNAPAIPSSALRASSPQGVEMKLTAKEKTIREQGLVSVLNEIQDVLDAAMLGAYGLSEL
ncbi:hypothetical protein [Stratiformator vulcanicus]|uniref:Uncharacterized protein n=1 Tax=Stratiformator vulcanicus TaxID=2527980 RepID=A0A517R3Z9_9PLAN|nr:hypothetical protein [Stratiformator vulcanicus]QDT38604.1 hypothetical protein Pan189_29990 [Stratiformator vulcanicus]